MAYLLYKHIKKRRAHKAVQDSVTTTASETPAPTLPEPGSNDLAVVRGSAEPSPSLTVGGDANGQLGQAEKGSNDVADPYNSPAAKRARTVYRWKLIGGLFFPFTVAALDTTMVAGALPFIASDFHQLAQLDWIVLSFNLTSAVFIPVWAQCADSFGRYASIQLSIIFMLIGSALCAGAPTNAFPMLLFGRAVLGIGCAGMNIVSKTVLADKVSLKENAKNTTIFTMVGGLGYGIGPTIGGYLTAAPGLSWRWIFIINCPLGVLGLLGTHVLLRKELLGPKRIIRSDGIEDERPPTFFRRLATIDWGGQLLFLFGVGLLLLALSWGGSYYAWTNAKVMAPLVIGLVLIVVFAVYEYFMVPGRAMAKMLPFQRAMIPFQYIATRNSGILIYINFITGMAMYAVFYFAVLYFTLVLNFGSGRAGLGVVYYIPGLSIGVYLAMFSLNVWPRQTFYPLFLGTFLEPVGMTLLAHALTTEIPAYIYCMIGLTGIGTGIRFMPNSLHAVGYYRSHIATMMSVTMLAGTFGGALGLSVMDNIFNSKVAHSGFSLNSSNFASLESIGTLDSATGEALKKVAKHAIVTAYYAITAFMWLGLVLMTGLGNLRIGRKAKKGTGGQDIPDRVWEGSYVFGKLTRRKGWKLAETEASDPHEIKTARVEEKAQDAPAETPAAK